MLFIPTIPFRRWLPSEIFAVETFSNISRTSSLEVLLKKSSAIFSRFDIAFFKFSTAVFMSVALQIAPPTTIIFAPAFTASTTVSELIPPATATGILTFEQISLSFSKGLFPASVRRLRCECQLYQRPIFPLLSNERHRQ